VLNALKEYQNLLPHHMCREYNPPDVMGPFDIADSGLLVPGFK
jgi:hypothetical protein